MKQAIRLIGIATLTTWLLIAKCAILLSQSEPTSQPYFESLTSPNDGQSSNDEGAPDWPTQAQRCDVSMDQPANRWWFAPEDIGGYAGPFRTFALADGEIRLKGLARGLGSADGRIEFSGQEVSFAAEGQLFADWFRPADNYWSSLTAEAYLNQPFDRNILVDDPLRVSFGHNFEVDSWQMSQLFLTLGRGSWALDLGKFVSPFGRYYGPIYTNSLSDVPFVRGESIHQRETGIQLRFAGGCLQNAIALTNGGADRDANSSKALIMRLGMEIEDWSGGFNLKAQDVNGSEGQKEFNNHVGFDLARQFGAWRVSGEFIYDQYGMRRPGFDLNDITWGRSLYNRQLNKSLNDPIEGFGWYVNALRRSGTTTTVFGFGQYFPETIGDRIHDQENWRVLIKQAWMLNSRTELFASTFFEGTLDNFAVGHDRLGYYLLAGTQFHF